MSKVGGCLMNLILVLTTTTLALPPIPTVLQELSDYLPRLLLSPTLQSDSTTLQTLTTHLKSHFQSNPPVKSDLLLSHTISDQDYTRAYGFYSINSTSVVNMVFNLQFNESRLVNAWFPDDSGVSVVDSDVIVFGLGEVQKIVGGMYSGYQQLSHRMVYLQTARDTISFVHEVVIYRNNVKVNIKDGNNTLENDRPSSPTYSKLKLFIDSKTGYIHRTLDCVFHLTYTAITHLEYKKPIEYQTLTNPEDLIINPYGWAGLDSTPNLIVNIDDDTVNMNTLLQSASSTKYDIQQSPFTKPNLDFLAMHVFYTLNYLHDVLYTMGFTELYGNYQKMNYNRGGVENDPIVVTISTLVKNDAYFVPSKDGNVSELVLGLDSITNYHYAMDPVVLMHEYTHGLSSRLVGGSLNEDCLLEGDGRSIGEGISDIVALVVGMNGSEKRNVIMSIGSFLYGSSKGFRSMPYSTDKSFNPITYGSVWNSTLVYRKAELVALVMLELYWNFVDAYGFQNLNGSKKGGNFMLLELVVSALKNLKCFPTFVDWRDAIFTADSMLYEKRNYCWIWTAFGSRGMGIDWSVGAESFGVPDECFAFIQRASTQQASTSNAPRPDKNVGSLLILVLFPLFLI